MTVRGVEHQRLALRRGHPIGEDIGLRLLNVQIVIRSRFESGNIDDRRAMFGSEAAEFVSQNEQCRCGLLGLPGILGK